MLAAAVPNPSGQNEVPRAAVYGLDCPLILWACSIRMRNRT